MKNNPEQKSLNAHIIEQLFVTVTLLKKSGDKRIFKKFGLTTSLFAVLTEIFNGNSSSTELQKYIEGTPASIAQKLKQLEGKGIIARRLDENDKRRWIFEITEKGYHVLSKIQPVYKSQLAALFEGYDDATKSDFLVILKELEERLR